MDPTARFESFSHFLQQQPSHIRPSTSSRRPSFQQGTGSKPSTSSFDQGQRVGQQQQQQQEQYEQQQKQQQRMAADQAYRATFDSVSYSRLGSASHERAVFQDEARTRARRRDAARNRALFRGPFYKRPEFYAVTLGFLGLLYPILNEYVIEP
ncbi:uncharacterized protein F4807DRAFT_461098 [Annulohypoxylon truncatum]|uniref:uncharacterized protein n=1 Tax=Annulohypoxylon truncatum TaxID=327061 RepID=UPI0020074069|nr:uncharacterized protein F4807DRAFT_461098 [Annulohypoxylon truncatum]KAI1208976.1 hypothetical protein F4807DRAFT_461098 [Annulohypoxylon truncatum]